MNKYQEALNSIVDYGLTLQYCNKQCALPQDKNTILTIQELVDRATPKMVVFRKQTHDGHFIHDDGTAETVKTIISYDYVCPICGHILNEDFQYQFCESCGQSIEWEKGEKK